MPSLIEAARAKLYPSPVRQQLLAISLAALSTSAPCLLAEVPCLPAPALASNDAADASFKRSSTYVPVDSWAYPALNRLYALGYLDDAFLGLRPWTRLTIARMLDQAAEKMADEEPDWMLLVQQEGAEPGGAGGREGRALLSSLNHEFGRDLEACGAHAELDTVYSLSRGITDTPLRDSFHLGQTLVNDYGRVYESGFHEYTGAQMRAERGRFSLILRGEYKHAPQAAGYSQALFADLSTEDGIPVATNPLQATIPLGPIPAANLLRVLEANASFRLAGHEFSFGKSDHWMGPAAGGAFAWSNNAENIYAFQIDRTDPLTIFFL